MAKELPSQSRGVMAFSIVSIGFSSQLCGEKIRCFEGIWLIHYAAYRFEDFAAKLHLFLELHCAPNATFVMAWPRATHWKRCIYVGKCGVKLVRNLSYMLVLLYVMCFFLPWTPPCFLAATHFFAALVAPPASDSLALVACFQNPRPASKDRWLLKIDF